MTFHSRYLRLEYWLLCSMATGVQLDGHVPLEIQSYFTRERRRNQATQRESDSQNRDDSSRTQAPRGASKPEQCENLGILTDKPKYKQYATLDSRIASLKNWPSDKTQTVKELAEAGFAYTGTEDSVRCFYCNIGLKDWPIGACPWEQHILTSPKCGHVIHCKGKAFIRKTLGDQLSDSDVEDSDYVIDTVLIAMNRNKEAVSIAKDYCSDEEILKMAIKALIKNDLHKKISAVELVKAMEVLQERKEELERMKYNKLHCNEMTDDIETDEAIDSDDEDFEETNRRLKEPLTCKICFDAVACIITLPCGHMVSCAQCVSALTACAVCRAKIKGRVRALMAI